jgi:hypothetical protein
MAVLAAIRNTVEKCTRVTMSPRVAGYVDVVGCVLSSDEIEHQIRWQLIREVTNLPENTRREGMKGFHVDLLTCNSRYNLSFSKNKHAGCRSGETECSWGFSFLQHVVKGQGFYVHSMRADKLSNDGSLPELPSIYSVSSMSFVSIFIAFIANKHKI